MKETAIGIDIGGTNTVFGLVDKQGNTIFNGSIATKGYSDVKHYIQTLSDTIKEQLAKTKRNYKLIGIGVGAPNGNYYKGTVEFAPNLEWDAVVPLADLIKEHFKVPVWLTNDANAGALGEMIYGGAKNMKDFIFITLGTGLGSGIVANGKLIYGHDGFAGEAGHIIVKENGRTCGCGRKGCLETYVSATGIKRTVFELLANCNTDSLLRNISFNELTSKKIYELAKKEDKIALKAFDCTAEVLGKAFADLVSLFSPEAFFLFGGLANAEDLLLKPVKNYMEKNLLKVFKNKIEILPSQLKSGQAAVLGASALAFSSK